jgi:hypothetical protein
VLLANIAIASFLPSFILFFIVIAAHFTHLMSQTKQISGAKDKMTEKSLNPLHSVHVIANILN